METFTEAHSKELLLKEWLVRVDNATSIPYVLKFGTSTSSDAGDTCVLLISDTKTVWAEVLTHKQLFHRWRACNPEFATPYSEEQSSRVLRLLQDAHTLVGIASAPFEIVSSRDADLAFELEFDGFKWRWDTYLLGPKTAATLLSTHLILPLLSLTHLAFSSADPVCDLTDEDLQDAVDKVGRTARRALDVHVKHTISKPRIATTIQRIGALLDVAPTLPPIRSETEDLNLDGHLTLLRGHGESVSAHASPGASSSSRHAENASYAQAGPGTRHDAPVVSTPNESNAAVPLQVDSATEESDGDGDEAPAAVSTGPNSQATLEDLKSPSNQRYTRSQLSPPAATSDKQSTGTATAQIATAGPRVDVRSDSDAEPGLPPPAKRTRTKAAALKKVSSSDSDSDGAPSGSGAASRATSRGAAASRGSVGAGRGAGARGVRQPIKRGAKRF